MLFSINRRKNKSNSSKFHKSLEHKDGELPGLTTPYFMNHHVQNTNCYLICRFKCFNNFMHKAKNTSQISCHCPCTRKFLIMHPLPIGFNHETANNWPPECNNRYQRPTLFYKRSLNSLNTRIRLNLPKSP